MPEERRASDVKLEAIEKKLDEHSNILSRMMETIQQIAVQNIIIQNIQAQMTEARGDINEIYRKIETISDFQARCPKSSLSILWGVIVTSLLGIVGTFTAHVLGGGK